MKFGQKTGKFIKLKHFLSSSEYLYIKKNDPFPKKVREALNTEHFIDQFVSHHPQYNWISTMLNKCGVVECFDFYIHYLLA